MILNDVKLTIEDIADRVGGVAAAVGGYKLGQKLLPNILPNIRSDQLGLIGGLGAGYVFSKAIKRNPYSANNDPI